MVKYKQKITYIVFFLSMGLAFPLQAADPKANKSVVPKVWFALARDGNTSLLQDLHDCCDIDINVKDKEYGSTALMHSAQQGRLDCVRHLIQQGASVLVTNKVQHTAFYYGAQTKNLNVVSLLEVQMIKYVKQLQNHIKELQNSTKRAEETFKDSGNCRLMVIQYWQRTFKISEIAKGIMLVITRYGDRPCVKS